jgi:ribonuclease P protein component
MDFGRSASSGPVVVYAFDRADGLPPRYALIVGRRWGDAVTRNRQRRLLREAFRTSRPELPAGFDLALLPRSKFADERMDAVRAALAGAAARAVARFRSEGPGKPRPRP